MASWGRWQAFFLGAVASCGDGASQGVRTDAGTSNGGLAPHGGSGPAVTVTGMVAPFGPSRGSLAGAALYVAEAPSLTTTVAADGSFTLAVPAGGDCSFVVHPPGFHDTQTAVLHVGASGLAQVGFQVPSEAIYTLFATVLHATLDPATCQIATTVSARGTAPYGGDALGVPGTTVTMDPPLPADHGPVYFNYYSAGVIAPDRSLGATTVDGGVLFLNVPPGDYELRASRAGSQFTTSRIRCRAGLLVNAAPPWGLQQL